MAARTTSAVAAPARSISLQSLALFGALLALVLASAFGVIHSSHDCRRLYAVLQQLEADQWYLQEDYGRLLLEQSTWASHYRVERVATRELNMQAPELEGLKVVRP
ncbi:MAG: cell division protein FtsL [Haliea sp.]|jgi:cell division protein FtsL|uniref:cell division protein FtsL n=1 Tax=Haliea sp. TaxID=1932666 RepID=UPI000C569761|nr:cell division protein FtsL [Haliea sp.]MBM70327.1 cell division protein FtsL [Haliea sp.]|tara:strand:+ start:1358 stop:1675 length:318 start_codon:yes stop_codon:yes gene_type:complete